MKKSLFAVIVLTLVMITACAKSSAQTPSQTVNDGKYKLYETQNMWTFLKLDTETGKVWQLQYSLDDSNAGQVTVSDTALNKDGKVKKGRFELYPTKNMYNFLLLDRETGAVYQIQWAMEASSRGLVNVISE